jgi:hypothetical protein
MNNMTNKKNISTEIAEYQIDEHNILHITMKGAQMTDENIESNYQILKDFLDGKKIKMYIDNSISTPYDKKQRLSFERQTDEFCEAMAITSNSVIGNAIANIFIAMSNSKVPIKLLKKKEQAIKWLTKQ